MWFWVPIQGPNWFETLHQNCHTYPYIAKGEFSPTAMRNPIVGLVPIKSYMINPYGGFPFPMGVPQNRWFFLMEHLTKMDDDWGNPHDLGNHQIDPSTGPLGLPRDPGACGMIAQMLHSCDLQIWPWGNMNLIMGTIGYNLYMNINVYEYYMNTYIYI